MVSYHRVENALTDGRKKKGISQSLGITKRVGKKKAIIRFAHKRCGLPKKHPSHVKNRRQKLRGILAFCNNETGQSSCQLTKSIISQNPCHLTKEMVENMKQFCIVVDQDGGGLQRIFDEMGSPTLPKGLDGDISKEVSCP